MYKRRSMMISKTQMIIAAVVVFVAIFIFKKLKTKREGFGWSDLNPVKVFKPVVTGGGYVLDKTKDGVDAAYNYAKQNGKCAVVGAGCGALFKGGLGDRACSEVAAEWAATCEVAGGGPEDPFADTCAAGAVPLELACSKAMSVGTQFGVDQCKAAIGC